MDAVCTGALIKTTIVHDESVGVVSSTEDLWSIEGASWIRGSIKGVPSNSAHPPLRPISTTRSSILPSSSFLDFTNAQPLAREKGELKK